MSDKTKNESAQSSRTFGTGEVFMAYLFERVAEKLQ
jgi:hypothetical protein